MKTHLLKLITAASLSLILAACGKQAETPAQDTGKAPEAASPAGKVVVYSARAEHLIKPLFEAYTQKTGIKIEYITADAGALMTRLQSEGATTPADILLTVDVGNLYHAENMGVLQPINSEVLNQNVPQYLRDENNQWFGLTLRARTIVYASDRVSTDELSTYEDLAAEKWKGRLCLRTSKKVYNQSLVASFIAHNGIEKTTGIVKGWVNNLAVAPFSNDVAAMEAIQAGQCDVALVNTYYFGRMEADGQSGSLKLFWPNQQTTGVHMNVSGAGVTKYAKHPKEAQALIEWLSSTEAQGLLAGLNLEFPVNPQVASVPQVQAWGSFMQDSLPLSAIAANQVEAIRLIDQVGYR